MARHAQLRKELNQVVKAFRPPDSSSRKNFSAEENPVWIRYHAGNLIEVPIKDLTDYHLMGAIIFLETHAHLFQQKTLNESVSVENFMRGKPSLDYTQKEISRIEKLSPKEFLLSETVYPKLVAESTKRGFPIPRLGQWWA
jgi:hypothetical protein